jgi:hypothetical protein
MAYVLSPHYHFIFWFLEKKGTKHSKTFLCGTVTLQSDIRASRPKVSVVSSVLLLLGRACDGSLHGLQG